MVNALEKRSRMDRPAGESDAAGNEGRLANKVALITGGARGMGPAHVRRFVEEGAKVLFTALHEDAAAALVEELGDAVRFVRADASVAADWLHAIALAEREFGPVNVLVNNAGILLRASIENMTEAEYRKVVDVNQLSVFLGMKHILPSMRRAGGGSIINIASVVGLVGRPNTIAYAATKAAIRGMTKVAASEFGELGIRVNSVHPGAVITPMFEGMGPDVHQTLTAELSIKRLARPEEVSDLVVFLASDESTYCTAAEFVVDGGLYGR